MALDKKSNLVEEAQGNLIELFRESKSVNDLVGIFVKQAQDLENSAFEILEDTTVSNAVGVQLDVIGKIVGEPRNGRDDANYRIGIQTRILLNKSSGTIEDLLGLVATFLSSPDVELQEIFPAAIYLNIVTELDVGSINLSNLITILQSAKAAGVLLQIQVNPVGSFRFDTPGFGFDQGLFAGVF